MCLFLLLLKTEHSQNYSYTLNIQNATFVENIN